MKSEPSAASARRSKQIQVLKQDRMDELDRKIEREMLMGTFNVNTRYRITVTKPKA